MTIANPRRITPGKNPHTGRFEYRAEYGPVLLGWHNDYQLAEAAIDRHVSTLPFPPLMTPPVGSDAYAESLAALAGCTAEQVREIVAFEATQPPLTQEQRDVLKECSVCAVLNTPDAAYIAQLAQAGDHRAIEALTDDLANEARDLLIYDLASGYAAPRAELPKPSLARILELLVDGEHALFANEWARLAYWEQDALAKEWSAYNGGGFSVAECRKRLDEIAAGVVGEAESVAA